MSPSAPVVSPLIHSFRWGAAERGARLPDDTDLKRGASLLMTEPSRRSSNGPTRRLVDGQPVPVSSTVTVNFSL